MLGSRQTGRVGESCGADGYENILNVNLYTCDRQRLSVKLCSPAEPKVELEKVRVDDSLCEKTLNFAYHGT